MKRIECFEGRVADARQSVAEDDKYQLVENSAHRLVLPAHYTAKAKREASPNKAHTAKLTTPQASAVSLKVLATMKESPKHPHARKDERPEEPSSPFSDPFASAVPLGRGN